MKPLRILVDSFADRDLTNAQMTNGRDIVRRLDADRFHVSMFCLGDPDPVIAARPNTRLIALPRGRQSLRIFREFLWGQHKILFYLKSAPASAWYLNVRSAWNDGRIVVGTVESQSDLRNEPTITPEAVRLWERTVLRSDALFSNSQWVRESLKREYGIASQIVPTGVDTRFFCPSPERSNSRPRVLFVGSLRPFKGPQVVLAAAARCPDADFVIAGDGPMAQQLRNQVQAEHLTNVTLCGALPPERIRQLYQEADLFLFPSQWEGSPRVILEAAACGLPVVARDRYHVETVVDGQTGYLAHSDELLFQRLEELLASADLRRNMGEQGRRHIQQFDWDRITRQWEEIFVRLAAFSGRGSTQ